MRPDCDRLLNLLSVEVDDAMLREIAEADYGDDFDLHLQVLQHIRDTGEVPAPMQWHPREVLSLIRWSEPDDPTWKPGATGRRGHVMRAFSCTALLRAAAEPQNHDLLEGENVTLAQLLASIEVLGKPYDDATLGFLIWHLDRMPLEVEERPFFVLAILYLTLKVRLDFAPAEIGEIIDRLIEEENAVRQTDWAVLPEHDTRWILGLTFYNQKESYWFAVGERLLALSETVDDRSVQKKLIDIADWLTI